MTTENEELSIDDLDKPVDEALLMGEDKVTDTDESEGEDKDAEGEDIDHEALAKIAADEEEAGEKTDEHKDDQKTVPQARFNQVYAEKKALEERLAALEGKPAEGEAKTAEPEKPVDIKSLRDKEASIEDELEQAMYGGDTDKSRELRGQLRALRGQIDDLVMSEAETRAERKLDQRKQTDAFQTKAAELEAKYPVLNPETGDPEAIEMVVALRDAYIAKGVPLTKALEAAVEKVAPHFTKADDKPADKEDGKPDARNVTAITRGAKDSNRIPPNEGGVGNRALTPKDTSDISVDEWEKLPQSEREKILAA